MEGEQANEAHDEGELVRVRQHPEADADLGKQEDRGTKDGDGAGRDRAVLAAL